MMLGATLFPWFVGCGWIVVLHIRSRMALPDDPPPMPTLHVVCGTISLSAIVFLVLYLLTPVR